MTVLGAFGTTDRRLDHGTDVVDMATCSRWARSSRRPTTPRTKTTRDALAKKKRKKETEFVALARGDADADHAKALVKKLAADEDAKAKKAEALAEDAKADTEYDGADPRRRKAAMR